ncbi:MAG: hypothetical protein ACTSXD_05100 [Candidatus Heimdallarchaeaceae archaeon]
MVEVSIQEFVDNQERINKTILDELVKLNEEIANLKKEKGSKFINQTKEGLD